MKGVCVATLFVVGVLFAQKSAAVPTDRQVPVGFLRTFLGNALGDELLPRVTLGCLRILARRNLIQLGAEAEEPARRGLDSMLKQLLNSRDKRGGGAMGNLPEVSDEAVLAFCGTFIPGGAP